MITKWTNRRGTVCGEITIIFLSSGYHDPGKLSGRPENCYPPEGDDERTLDKIIIEVGGRSVDLTGELAERIFALFQDEVDAEEMDMDADEPDYDAIREAREEHRFDEDQRI